MKRQISCQAQLLRFSLMIFVFTVFFLAPQTSSAQRSIDTQLWNASKAGDAAAVRRLLARGANPNMKTGDGLTPLMAAAHNGHLAVVQALLARRANINASSDDGNTALIWASHNGHLPIVRTLVVKGARINMKDNNGTTALMEAAHHGFTSIGSFLLARGADVFVEDVHGHTALDIAVEKNNSGIAALLRNAQNKPCPRSRRADYTFRLNEWKSTGIAIKRGDRITFDASGYITFGAFAGGGGPEGINGFRGYNLIRGNLQHGALIAIINPDIGWYEVGRGRTITAKANGKLTLAVNDDEPGNNSGYFTVKVSICKAR